MTWYLPVSANYNTTSAAIALLNGDGVDILRGVVVTNARGAVISSSSNALVTVEGIVASYGGSTIKLGIDSTTSNGNRLTIAAGAEVFNADAFTDAIVVSGYSSTIYNDGLIRSRGYGISYQEFAAHTQNDVFNTGIIKAGRWAFNIAADATTTFNLHNSGVITGDQESYDGYVNTDRIYNTGTISGLMKLSGGNDLYSGALGHINGTVRGEDGLDILLGGTEANIFSGGNDADNLQGNGGNDQLSGDAGIDTLSGGLGNDTLHGGTEGDNLTGGLGADLLFGDAGADRLIFASIAESTVALAGQDTIFGFSRAEGDKINLSLIDAKAGTVANDAFSFIGLAAFTGVKGQLHYTHTTTETYVSGDINGDKVADFMIHLHGNIALIATDFFA